MVPDLLADNEPGEVSDTGVHAMLGARSIAVVGASDRAGSFGHRLVTETLRSDPSVVVHLVNPRAGTIEGRPVLAGLDAVDGPVDLVLVGVADGAVEGVLQTAAARGDRSAVVYGSLFEPDDPTSMALRHRVSDIARDAGMALCGAGCMGFVTPARGVRAVGYVERDPLPAGPVALVTHSGSVFSALLRTRRHLGFSVVVSAGQELVTGAADYLEYALDLEETRVVGLFLETMREPAALRLALERAAARDVAVVALTVGASESGRSMVAAHSGALAGGDGAWEALFEATGVLRVSDLDELCDTLELFAQPRRARRRRPGSGLATVHDSGGERTLVVDLAEALDVPFAVIGEATTSRLAALLDTGLRPENPLDCWGTGGDTETLFTEATRAMAADDAVDLVALGLDFVAEYDGDESYPRAAMAAASDSDVVVAVLSNCTSAIDDATVAPLRAAGIPVLEGTRSGLLALRHFLEFPDRTRMLAAAPPVDDDRRAQWVERLAGGPLTADESVALLADYGIASPTTLRCTTAAEVSAAGEVIGFPVVLKTDMEGIAHKSDVGGVVLGIVDGAALDSAYFDLAARFGPDVIVAESVPAGVEVALGLARDPHLGVLMVVGAGGVLVELLADRAVRLAPLDRHRASAAVASLRVSALLAGVRGAPPADLDALIDDMVALSTLALELGECLDGLDVNPLSCGPKGCLALDVLIEPRRR